MAAVATGFPHSRRADVESYLGALFDGRGLPQIRGEHPHDAGSQANETVDGLDATTEALRHAAEDTPSGARPDDVEKTPVFDRAGAAPKI
jgi:hypothetical protein